MQVQTYSKTRANFKASIESVIDRHEPLLITSKSADVILISKQDYDILKETAYLMTKEPESPFSFMDTNSPAWSAICEYTLDHRDDIEIGINDFGTLRPVLDFFSRNLSIKPNSGQNDQI
jgi:prevent-host-death family protein